MKKGYAFTPNEFIAVHPTSLSRITDQLDACTEVLALLQDYAGYRIDKGHPDHGFFQCLDMLVMKLEEAKGKLEPEALRQIEATMREGSHA